MSTIITKIERFMNDLVNNLVTWTTFYCRRGITWWLNHQEDIINVINRILNSGSRAIRNGAMIGIAINVLAFFWPELRETCPVIFEFYGGFLVLAEFAVKGALKFFASIFTGTFPEFWDSYGAEFHVLLSRFQNWITTL